MDTKQYEWRMNESDLRALPAKQALQPGFLALGRWAWRGAFGGRFPLSLGRRRGVSAGLRGSVGPGLGRRNGKSLGRWYGGSGGWRDD
ncbi:MAG: hypothetical protein JWQ71_4547 [Pedosphaera sp.]|nr:hypothetical protein [Pedosphaera sp.]